MRKSFILILWAVILAGCVAEPRLPEEYYGEYGQDIICAAVSSLALNMANSVEEFTEDHFEGSVSDDGGYFSFSFPDEISPESQLLMKSLILGLQNIQRDYGAEYINFRFREV